MPSPLLTANFLQKLERLHFRPRRAFAGQIQGERRSLKKGASIEFADYREYAPGDDLRYVDWKAYGRLARLFLKLFVEEEDLSIHLLVDTSQSMAFGTPSKADYARRLAAALGFIGLAEYDRVSVAAFADNLLGSLAPLRGRGAATDLFTFLEGMPVGGQTHFATAIRRYAGQRRSPGIALILSDFFDPSVPEGLKALTGGRFQVALLQIVSPEEADPELTGDLSLVDSETGRKTDVSLSPSTIAQYKAGFAAFCRDLEALAHRYDMSYARLTTDVAFEDVLLRLLRAQGLVR